MREYEREDSLLSVVGGTIILADRGGIAWLRYAVASRECVRTGGR